MFVFGRLMSLSLNNKNDLNNKNNVGRFVYRELLVPRNRIFNVHWKLDSGANSSRCEFYAVAVRIEPRRCENIQNQK